MTRLPRTFMDTPAAAPLTNYQELVELLRKDGVAHRPDAAAQAVQIPVEVGGKDGLLVIRWQTQDHVIQFIQTMLDQIPADRLPAMESAIARLNHGLAIPGFDLNHEHGLVCFRLYLTLIPRGHVQPEEVRAMFTLTLRNAAMFLPTLQRIVD